MNYQRIYNELIAEFADYDGEGEWHHIIPRCMGGADDKSNLVKLPYRHHLFAHRLLCAVYPTETRLALAVTLMVGKRTTQLGKAGYKLFELDKRRASAATRERLTGKSRTPSKKWLDAMFMAGVRRANPKPEGVKVWLGDEDHPNKRAKNAKGSKLMGKGELKKIVHPELIQQYLDEGWELKAKPAVKPQKEARKRGSKLQDLPFYMHQTLGSMLR